MSIYRRPGDRLIDPAAGEPIIKAGDRKKRVAQAAARRAEKEARDNDPARQQQLAEDATRRQRDRISGIAGEAAGKLDRVRNDIERFIAKRGELDRLALGTTASGADAIDTAQEAAYVDRQLAQLARLLPMAEAEAEAARVAVDTFDRQTSERAAARAAELRAGQQDTDHGVVEEPKPAPIPVAKPKKGGAK